MNEMNARQKPLHFKLRDAIYGSRGGVGFAISRAYTW